MCWLERHMMRVLITGAPISSTFFAETCAVTSANERKDGEPLNKQRRAAAAVGGPVFHRAFESDKRKTSKTSSNWWEK